LGLEYIWLAPGFAKEVLEVYENWEGKESVPMKIKELMMVLRIEVDKRYTPDAHWKVAAMPKVPEFRDTKLD
jgi:hypothetical protein